MKKVLPLLVFAFTASFIQAQSDTHERNFASQFYMRQIEKTDDKYISNRDGIESQTYKYKYYGVPDSVTIPVVFHILYDGSTKPTITLEDIEAQLARLNTDYFTPEHPYARDKSYEMASSNDERLDYLQLADQKEGFAKIAAATMIRFCLPTTDPNGLPTNGVILVPSDIPSWGMDNAIKNSSLGGSSPWDTKKYCNIWIGNLADNMAGFAQMPGASDETDGIVIDQRYFQRAQNIPQTIDLDINFSLGRTLVHLMGTYLNLYELWNEKEPCGDDFVDDTPIHNAPNFGKGEYRHVSTCGDNPVEMTMNLMDSGYDSTMYLFTLGQMMRMHATLDETGSRYELTKTPISCKPIDGGFLEDPISERNDNKLVHKNMQLSILPNPNHGMFTLEIKTENIAAPTLDIVLHDDLGRLVLKKSISNIDNSVIRYPFNDHQLAPGVYILQVFAGQEVQTVKILVQ